MFGSSLHTNICFNVFFECTFGKSLGSISLLAGSRLYMALLLLAVLKLHLPDLIDVCLACVKKYQVSFEKYLTLIKSK